MPTAVLNKDSVAKYAAGVKGIITTMISTDQHQGTLNGTFLQEVADGFEADLKEVKTLTQAQAAGTLSVRIALASKKTGGTETMFDNFREVLTNSAEGEFLRQAGAQASLEPLTAGQPLVRTATGQS
jgi:hypothetical protein